MDVVVDSLKSQRPYNELKEVLNNWQQRNKEFLFLDLAILHKNFEGVKLIGDVLGPNVYLTTYDDFDKVTPVYVAQLLSRIHSDYAVISEYMLQRIEDEKPWNRRKFFLWVSSYHKFPLPGSLLREIACEYL